MAEFRVGDHVYQSRKMNARMQFHVARRLAPLIGHLASLGPLLAIASDPQFLTDEATAQAFERAVIPFAEGLAKIPDEDADYVLDRCMQMVQRGVGGNGSGAMAWQDIWNMRANRLQFEDIELPEMMQIAMNVVGENLGGFFSQTPLPPATAAAIPAASNGSASPTERTTS